MQYFITGTGTGIGKTFTTCKMVRQLKAVGKNPMAIKPVITGWVNNPAENDTLQILTSLGLKYSQENIEKISPWRFTVPLAPSMAAEKEGRVIDYPKLVEFCKSMVKTHDNLLIEGAGGVMVPLTGTKTSLDLMQDIGIPVILVTGSYLGTISHTLTAIAALESGGVDIDSVVVNESENNVIPLEETAAELRKFCKYDIMLEYRNG